MPPHDVHELAALLQSLARRIGANDIADAVNHLVSPPPNTPSGRWTPAMRERARQRELARCAKLREQDALTAPVTQPNDVTDDFNL